MRKQIIRVRDFQDAKLLLSQKIEDGEDCDELVIVSRLNEYLGTNRGDDIAIFNDADDARDFEREMIESGYERLGEDRWKAGA
jgi:hypothetical protein